MSKPRLLWHSNGPHTPTGYGQQTALFTPLLADQYEVAVSAFWGLEGAPIKWKKNIWVLPGLGADFGNGTLPQHAEMLFGGDRRNGTVMTLMDVWPLDPNMARSLNMVCWVPVDHQPAPPQVYGFFMNSGAVPIAMSRFGERMLEGLDPLYCPHGVDTQLYKPLNKTEVRRGQFPKGAFVVGMVAANKGTPSRKAFSQALLAFKRFAEKHDNAYLYLHTTFDGSIGQGVNIPALVQNLEITDRVRGADQYKLLYHPHTTGEMAQIYSAMDVLLNPSFGEGFGIPVLEAQACGVPGIVTDWTAMPEICAAGWHVKYQEHWTGLGSWQVTPDVDDIVAALEECYEMPQSRRGKLSAQARQHALTYDVRHVYHEYMLPALKTAEERFEARRPVTIPDRRERTVSIVTPWRDHPEFGADFFVAMDAAKPDELIIIDDGSKAPIEAAAFRFDESVGYVQATNKGLELASSDVVVFLNNDIKLVDLKWLDRLVAQCEPGVLVGELRQHHMTRIDGQVEPYIDGWCIAGMREDLEGLGGLDAAFNEPAYYCDNDLCLRAKMSGMRLVDTIVGLEHLTNGTTNDDVAARERASEANHKLYTQRVRDSRAIAA